jgi:hypothetical protein
MSNRRKFRATLMNEIHATYFAEERERDKLMNALRGMGWVVEEFETSIPGRPAAWFRCIELNASETTAEDAPSICVQWQEDKVYMSILRNPDTFLYSDELDVADNPDGRNESGSFDCVLNMVKEGIWKLNK